MIQMIVTDLDETLLRSDKTVSDYTKKILGQARRKGIKTAFATARGSTAHLLLSDIFFDAKIVMNGARAYADERLVYEKTISRAVSQPFLRAVGALGIMTAAQIQGWHYANFNVHQKWNDITRYSVTDFHALPGDADKLYAVIESPEQVDAIESLLPDMLYMHVSRDHLAMIMHKEATKMNAISAVADHWGICVAHIAAFGDDVNDIEMLSKCGTGIAMGNALDRTKAVANHTCDTNNQDGLAKWIAQYVL